MIKPTCRKSSARSSPLLSYFLLIAQPASQPSQPLCHPPSTHPASFLLVAVVTGTFLRAPLSYSIYLHFLNRSQPPPPHPRDPPHPLWWPRWRPLTKTYYPGRYTATLAEKDRLRVSKRWYTLTETHPEFSFFRTLLQNDYPKIVFARQESRHHDYAEEGLLCRHCKLPDRRSSSVTRIVLRRYAIFRARGVLCTSSI